MNRDLTILGVQKTPTVLTLGVNILTDPLSSLPVGVLSFCLLLLFYFMAQQPFPLLPVMGPGFSFGEVTCVHFS